MPGVSPVGEYQFKGAVLPAVPGNVGRPVYLLKLVVSPLARRGGTISGAEYWVPQPIAAGGNCTVSRFRWAVTGGPRYLQYRTLTKRLINSKLKYIYLTS
jgi:hypothetical protein